MLNISYIRLLQSIESFASAHLQVQKFASDFPAQMPNFSTTDEAYPILFVSPTTSIFDINSTTFEVDVYCFDIIQKDRENINTILSDTNLILSDLARWFNDGQIVGIDLLSSSATPIDNGLLDYAAGWVMRMNFEVGTYGICEIPFDEAPVIITEVNDIVYSRWLTCETLVDCPVIIDIQSQLTGQTRFDVFVTGGTYSNGTAEFVNNSGGTFSVSGFSTGNTASQNLQEVTDIGNTTTNGIIIDSQNLLGQSFNVINPSGFKAELYSDTLQITAPSGIYSLFTNGAIALADLNGDNTNGVNLNVVNDTTNYGVGFVLAGSPVLNDISLIYHPDYFIPQTPFNSPSRFYIPYKSEGTYTLATLDDISGATGNQNLQQVTDIGANTTNDIKVYNLSDNKQSSIESTLVTSIDIDANTYANLQNEGIIGVNSNGVYDGLFKSSLLTQGNVTLEFPNKTSNTYTIATLDDLSGFSSTDIFVTGGTYSNGTSTFTNNTGGTFSVTGFNTTSGTVTSVSALTIGTTGTDITSTVANATTTPVITLNIPTASASNRGALSSTDWSTFNNKQNTSTLLFDSFEKAIIRSNYFYFLPSAVGNANTFGYSPNIAANQFVLSNNVAGGTKSMTLFNTTSTAGTLAFMRRHDGLILTSMLVKITRKIQFQTNISGQRFFCGITKGNQFSAPTNVEPNTLTDIVGVCQLSSSTNMQVIYNDASGTATTVDLGSSYPCNDPQYNYFISIEQTTTSYIITVERVTVATQASISTTTTTSSNIPVYNTGTIQLCTWITNNATASVASYLDGGCIGTFKN